MVLVDTSVWIRGLAGVGPIREELDRLLANNEVAGHDLVYGELLVGDRGGRKRPLAMYERMRQASVVSHAQVVALVHHRDLTGRGLGWIDLHLLASALSSGFQLWTADRMFAEVARELGVGYQPVRS